MSSSWTTIENAIHAWIAAGTGLGASKVIWSKQDSPRPAAPYVALSATVRNIGRGWTDKSLTEDPEVGGELTHTHRTVKRLDLRVQCFGGDATESGSPMAMLSNAVDYAGLPSQRTAFRAGGWAPVDFQPVLDFSGGLGGATFEPRVVLECHGYITGEVSETGTYIQIAQVTDETRGTTEEYDGGEA